MTSRRSASASKEAEASRSSAEAAAAAAVPASTEPTDDGGAKSAAETMAAGDTAEQKQQQQQQQQQGGTVKDEEAEHDEQDEEEEEGTSSGQGSEEADASTKGAAKGKKKQPSKRKVKGAAAAARAARIAKTHQSSKTANGNGDEGAVEEEGAANETDDAEKAAQRSTAVKAEDPAEEGLAVEDTGRGPQSRSHSSETGQSSRNRSTSTFKELAGLGLGKLGDGEEEPLMPRRSRRSGASPNNAKPSSGDSGNDEDEESNGSARQQGQEAPLPDDQEQQGADTGAGVEANGENNDDDDDDDQKAGGQFNLKKEGAAAEEAPDDGDQSGGDTQEPSYDEEEVNEEGVTRCVCGSADENVGLMIQCETCKCWQHCICMGMHTEDDCPDVYFCEQCRPELHIPLLRSLGVLPPPRSHKKGASKVQGRNVSRDSTRELREAKEAVLTLAKENERRRKEGLAPVTGWSVAQGQHAPQHPDDEYGTLHHEVNAGRRSSSQHRRQTSEAQNRNSRSQSRDDEHGRALTTPKSPPKRRSTMNSRDSAYGWEPIPPGLLNEDENWEGPRSAHSSSNKFDFDEDRSGGKKRKRQRGPGEGDEGDENQDQSPSAGADGGADEGVKRMKVERPPNDYTIEEEEEAEGVEPEDAELDEARTATAPTEAQAQASAAKKSSGGGGGAKRAKHPNQYTARRAMAAANAANGGQTGSASPSPSKRHLDSVRKAALRDSTAASRMGTPTPGEGSSSRNANHPGGPWGMPEHLSHLAWLLPTTAPETLNVSVPSTKGVAGSQPRNVAALDASNATPAKAGQRVQASPQPYHVVALQESSTKVRFPAKRTTMGEMRKRVRNISDYVTRIQIEAAEREKRMRFLGISVEEEVAKERERMEAIREGEKEEQEAAAREAESNGQGESEKQDILDKDGDAQMNSDEVQAATAAASETDKGNVQQESPVATGANSTEVAPTPESASKSTEEGESGSDAAATTAATAARTGTAPLVRPTIGADSRATDISLSSMLLVDELTRELVSFQAKYGTAGLSF